MMLYGRSGCWACVAFVTFTRQYLPSYLPTLLYFEVHASLPLAPWQHISMSPAPGPNGTPLYIHHSQSRLFPSQAYVCTSILPPFPSIAESGNAKCTYLCMRQAPETRNAPCGLRFCQVKCPLHTSMLVPMGPRCGGGAARPWENEN